MRLFTSMSSTSGFKARGRGSRWHRSYSDRTTASHQQPSPPTSETHNANSSSEPVRPHSRPDGPRGPRPYTGYYTPQPPRGRGPTPHDIRPHSAQHFGPHGPGPGHNHQRPTHFHGQGPPYTGPHNQVYMQQPYYNQVPPPQQYYNQVSPPQQYYNQQPPPHRYRVGTPNGMRVQMNGPQYKEMSQQQQPTRPNKLALYKRKWRFPPTRVPPQCERFRLLSYNILADYLAVQHSTLYSHVPFHMLAWPWRMSNLLFEFQLWSPDVLCLQEVDRFPELQTELESRGYSGIWKIRTGNAIDGCAIFWRINRFKLLHHEYIEFSQIGLKDNVAQFCVLESVGHTTPENDSSSTKPSRVVVFNIHVLFNPKRGDIKLGQVRTLIDQAMAVSKSWDDAPVVLCGDFNSTPNSPLYKFILEQKLDLSGLARSQISGQETGNALASVPSNYKFPRLSSSISTMNGTGENMNQSSGTDAYTTSSSLVQKGSTLCTESDATETSESIGNDHVAAPIQEAKVPPSVVDYGAAQGLKELDNDSSNVISSDDNDPRIENLHLGEVSQSIEHNDSASDFINTAVKQPEKTHIQNKNETTCTNYDESQKSEDSNNPTTSTIFVDKHSDTEEMSHAKNLGDDNKILQGNCVIDRADEDNTEPNFLSELLGTQDEFGFKWSQDEFSSETNNSSEIIEASSSRYPPYIYKWTPDELKAATGSEDCTFLEHNLKLRSVYTDVEDNDGTKGSHCEPEATSYNQNFLGTVDYIWSSEGLQTVKVLDTIPKDILQETKGFPTKKWGSDHIALVCELAFRND